MALSQQQPTTGDPYLWRSVSPATKLALHPPVAAPRRYLQVTTVLDAAEVEGGGVRRVCGSGANWLVVLIVSLFGAPRGSVCRMIGLSDCGWVKLRV